MGDPRAARTGDRADARVVVAVAVAAVGLVVLSVLLASVTAMSATAAVPVAVGGAAVATLAVRRPGRDSLLAWSAAAPAVASLAVTALVLARGRDVPRVDGLYGLVEVVLLDVVLAATVRWATGPRLWVVAVLTASAQVLWILRFLPDRSWVALVAGCALWSVPALVAVVVGGYPRLAAERLRRSVTVARAEQRRALERDMHDFVAHDVTGMIVQAQAARFTAADDPALLREALARIEQSGQRAMSSIDRALELLGPEADLTAAHRPGLEDLERLVSDFGSAGDLRVDLRVDGDVSHVPREVGQTVHRVCTEALTNVRRHATRAASVTVRLEVGAADVRLQVEDDGGTSPARRRTGGGTGLRDVRARAEALGGTVTAGPTPSGWRTTVVLPLPPL